MTIGALTVGTAAILTGGLAGGAMAAAGVAVNTAAATATAVTGSAAAGLAVEGAAYVVGGVSAASLTGQAVSAGIAGLAGGPLGVLFLCFDPETTVMKSNGQSLKVKNLVLGDEILTQESLDSQGRVSFTKVTNASVINGAFDAHKFFLANGNSITVTSPHLMFIIKDGEMVAIKAKDVQTHDIMPLKGGKLSKVVEIQNVKLSTKVNIETAAGTLFANSIFVTGFCENSPSIGNNNASDFIKYYRSTHVY